MSIWDNLWPEETATNRAFSQTMADKLRNNLHEHYRVTPMVYLCGRYNNDVIGAKGICPSFRSGATTQLAWRSGPLGRGQSKIMLKGVPIYIAPGMRHLILYLCCGDTNPQANFHYIKVGFDKNNSGGIDNNSYTYYDMAFPNYNDDDDPAWISLILGVSGYPSGWTHLIIEAGNNFNWGSLSFTFHLRGVILYPKEF